MESLTKKEKIAQYLLSQNKWMSAVEIAEGLGIERDLVHSAMPSVMREKRYITESEFVPRKAAKGPSEIKMYRISAIADIETKDAKKKDVKTDEREQKKEETPQIRWITDPVLVRMRLRDFLAVRSGASL